MQKWPSYRGKKSDRNFFNLGHQFFFYFFMKLPAFFFILTVSNCEHFVYLPRQCESQRVEAVFF